MTHSLTIGQTLSGKTALNKLLSNGYLARGVGVVVLDPMNDPGWNTEGRDNFFQTQDAEEFLDFVMDPERCLQAALFVDETGISIDKYAVKFSWLTCQSRHHGMRSHIIANRAEMVSKNIRSQCSTLYLFNSNLEDCKTYAKDFNCPAILEGQNLPQGHFLKVQRFRPVIRGRLW